MTHNMHEGGIGPPEGPFQTVAVIVEEHHSVPVWTTGREDQSTRETATKTMPLSSATTTSLWLLAFLAFRYFGRKIYWAAAAGCLACPHVTAKKRVHNQICPHP